LVASSSAGDLSARVAEVAQRASTDRARFNEEIVKLQHLLDESRANEQQATKKLKLGGYKDHADKTSLHDLQEALKNLQAKNDHVSHFAYPISLLAQSQTFRLAGANQGRPGGSPSHIASIFD